MAISSEERRVLEWLEAQGGSLMLDPDGMLRLARYVGVDTTRLAAICKDLKMRRLIHRAEPGDPFENNPTELSFLIRLEPAGKNQLREMASPSIAPKAESPTAQTDETPKHWWSYLNPRNWGGS